MIKDSKIHYLRRVHLRILLRLYKQELVRILVYLTKPPPVRPKHPSYWFDAMARKSPSFSTWLESLVTRFIPIKLCTDIHLTNCFIRSKWKGGFV